MTLTLVKTTVRLHRPGDMGALTGGCHDKRKPPHPKTTGCLKNEELGRMHRSFAVELRS